MRNKYMQLWFHSRIVIERSKGKTVARWVAVKPAEER
jgi:hypothetical protein